MDPAAISAFNQIVHELEVAITGITATKYLTAAGLVVLLYDHVLLFEEETRLIWPAKRSWSKFLFLFNRYTVPAYIIVTLYQQSGFKLATAGLSTVFCKTWPLMAIFLNATTLAITNVFVVLRVYALWGHNRKILMVLIGSFTVAYLCVFVAGIFGAIGLLPHLSYSIDLSTCTVDVKPDLNMVAYAAPLLFDVFLFILTCWNALDRPRHMQTPVVKQLYLDGAVYFIITLTLRLFNICVIAAADIAYVQLGNAFIWSMIPAVINRMLINISSTLEDPQSMEPLRQLVGRNQSETPFEFSGLERSDSVAYRLQSLTDTSSLGHSHI